MLNDATNEELLTRWQAGSETAAQILVERYMQRLTALARSRLSHQLAQRIEAEDIVLSAWRSFFVGIGKQKFSVPYDDDLWPLLVTITLRKLAKQADRHLADRRHVGRDQSIDTSADWRAIVSRDPSPEEAATLIDDIQSLISQMDDTTRDVFTRRLHGERQTDIARDLGCSERTVRRAMTAIRNLIVAHDSSFPVRPNLEFTEKQSLRPPHESDAGKTTNEKLASYNPPSFRYSDFTLNHMIGAGGFGKVYRATLHANGATVAVKFLRKSFWHDQRAVNSLLAESHLVSRIRHPHIVRHRGWGTTTRGAIFLVMDWIDGQNVEQWRRLGPMPEPEIIQCGMQIAAAVEASHAVGVVHGDVTPRNVLKDHSGNFWLTDFGFAQNIGDETTPHHGGTPGFLAPEQISNAFGTVDTRTDIYGLGGLLYFLVTGSPPIAGVDLPEILANVLSSRGPNPFPNSSVSRTLTKVIIHCLQKEPTARPHSIAEVQRALVTPV